MRAGHLPESLDLVGGLDAFGDDTDPQVVGQSEDGLDDGSRVLRLVEPADERPVDLELVAPASRSALRISSRAADASDCSSKV